MSEIRVTNEFEINGEPIKLVSGAVHYFRIIPQHWEDTLTNLRAMGCNSVETYIPWNFHEKHKGEFDFTGQGDLVKFINIAQQLDLYVIVRPSPYICAEWEFGGLPYWLLKYKDMKLRSSDSQFIEHVRHFYKELFKLLVPLQINNGGPIILMQLENEYGSYGNDKKYLKSVLGIMREFGAEVPIFTSDGAWEEALEAGSLVEEGVFPTGNFGSKSNENIGNLKEFMKSKNVNYPIICMEFWNGWFNRWGEEIIRRDPKELQESVKEMLELGSINFYMFQGGTNFGFMNGCSARGNNDLHQVTSYDYDAFLTEWGDLTEKYHLVQSLLVDEYKNKPDTKEHNKRSYGKIQRTKSVNLFDTLEYIAKPINNTWTLPMELLDQGYGYILYRSNIGKKRNIQKCRIIEASDRAQVFLNTKHISTQFKQEIGQEFILDLDRNEDNQLDILVENMGRVNYGSKLAAPTQSKGIRSGVMLDLHYQSDWDHYCLDLENIEKIRFNSEFNGKGPAFHKYEFDVDICEDTFLDCSGFGKGCAFINGFNLGRFWEKGPISYLYIPGPLLNNGTNEIVIFETEGKYNEDILLLDRPIYKEI